MIEVFFIVFLCEEPLMNTGFRHATVTLFSRSFLSYL